MPLFSRIQIYILRECLSGLALVLGIFILAIVLVDVVEQMRTVGGDIELTPIGAIRLTLMKLPMLIEQTLPFAILIGAVIAYSRLNRRSELSIIRASGMSAWRFLTPAIVMAAAFGVFATTVLNPLGASLTARFEEERSRLLEDGRPTMQIAQNGVWLRQGDDSRQIVIHADGVEGSGGATLTDVKLIEEERLYINGRPTQAFAFVRRIDARRARLLDGFWQLENIVENVPGSPPIQRDFLSIPTNLDADKLLDEFASPNTIGFWALPGFIEQASEAGLDGSRYAMRWHSLLAAPVLFVAMALIGAIACLRLARLGGTPRLIATGATAAIGLFFITQFASSLGASGAAPPIVAAWSPALFALFTTLTLIAYREDG
ncbi:MAG: LptF/LptG family permease [Pseudomonadota bacterium]